MKIVFPFTPLVAYHFIPEATIDHTGPMTQTCLDNAILLKAVAGRDELDSRTAGAPLSANVPDYPTLLMSMKGLDLPLKGYRIGLVKEGFELCDKGGLNDPRVGAKVKEAAQKWEQLGATVEEVSIPVSPSRTVFPTCSMLSVVDAYFWVGIMGLYQSYGVFPRSLGWYEQS